MKKILHIKWENIIGIALILLFITCIISHIIRNGFDMFTIELEIIIYSLAFAIMYESIYALRIELLRKEL